MQKKLLKTVIKLYKIKELKIFIVETKVLAYSQCLTSENFKLHGMTYM